MNPTGEQPSAMLNRENQWTQPWGGSEDGTTCEKCQRSGVTEYRCWSCLLTTRTPECPACAGKVRWSDVCPVCRGSGVVDGAPRRGVSVYPRLEGLYHYMLSNDAELDDCLVVELEAQRASDVDFDADDGALLVLPTAICACTAPDKSVIGTVRERAHELQEQSRL
jgi:hypothetical protein